MSCSSPAKAGAPLPKHLHVVTKNDYGIKKDDTAVDASPTTASLFQQSAGKLGPLSQPSFSFSSDISEGAMSVNKSNLSEHARQLEILLARSSSDGARTNIGQRSAVHSTTTPSMAQLRARKIMSEAHKTKSCRIHSLPMSPTSEGSVSEETSTDVSSYVDLETVTHVSHFIDSLQKRGQGIVQNKSPQASPTQVAADSSLCHFRAEITTRYQSSLANARNAMAASPIAKGFTSSNDKAPLRDDLEVETDVDLAGENSSDEVTPDKNVDFSPANVTNQVPKTKADHGKSIGGNQSNTSSLNIRKDVHYYAILAQIQKIVRSDNASISLGKILADASKRGMSMDVVTEIYKHERFKAKNEPRDKSPHGCVKTEKVAPPEVEAFSTMKKNDGCTRFDSRCGSARTQAHKDIMTSISGEIADDIVELSRLCDEATALFTEDLSDNDPNLNVTRDTDSKLKGDAFTENQLSSLEVDQFNVQNLVRSGTPSRTVGVDNTAPLVQNFSASVLGACGKSFDSSTHNQDVVDNTQQAKPSVITSARGLGLPTDQVVKMRVKELFFSNKTGISDVTLGEGGENDMIHETPQLFAQNVTLPVEGNPNPQKSIENNMWKDHEGDFSIPGLNEVQLRQLKQLVKKAEELREADLSAQVCIDGAMKQSMRESRTSNPPVLPANGRANTTSVGHADNSEEIDAFFLRFSIQKDGDPTLKDCEGTPLSERKVGVASELREEGTDANRFDCSELIEGSNEDCGIKSLDQSHFGEITFQNDTLESVCQVESMEGATKGNGRKPKYQSGEGDNCLPKHLGLWKSPWQRNHPHVSEIFQPDLPVGIQAAGSFPPRTGGGKRRQCFLSLHSRLMGHTGYLNIDFYSLYEATAVEVEDQDIDQAPWEYRDVGQRFLHEKSLESRNWFGSFELERGNDRIPNPVCRPKSLEVSVTKIPEPGEWSEDWFTTWKSRKDNPNNLVTFAQDEAVERSTCQSYPDSTNFDQRSSPTQKKVVVEIGSLCPVRVKGGERVSRIHPEFTSYLRQSRWRKKYLKGSMFPTN